MTNPGDINKPNLIDQCAEALSNGCDDQDFLHYYPWQRQHSYAHAVKAVTNVLRSRGLLNELGLEILDRDSGETK